MIIIDTELKQRAAAGRPVRVGLAGAGFMGRGIAHTIVNAVPGMRLVAIANRTLDRARAAYDFAGVDDVAVAASAAQIEDAATGGGHVVTDDAMLLCEAEGIDVVLESTGDIGFAARLAEAAIGGGKHVVLNAEVDATVGPILKVHGDRAGVVVSGCDGDQPAVQMNLHRFVKGIGFEPLLCGNIKGMQDRYRTPATQAAFAAAAGLSPHMATSFADGTKISLEQAVVANATGMRVARRGMLGHEHRGHIDGFKELFDVDELRRWGGIVDYALGTEPGPGVFVLAAATDPKQLPYLRYCKLGDGPLYTFYVPYHLMTFEAHVSLARAVLFRDAAIAPIAGPVVDVVATAKRDLRRDEVLDGVGGFATYGLCENSGIVQRDRLLPMGLANGCRMVRDVPKDKVLTRADVVPPADSLVHRLRQEQDALFGAPDGGAA